MPHTKISSKFDSVEEALSVSAMVQSELRVVYWGTELFFQQNFLL